MIKKNIAFMERFLRLIFGFVLLLIPFQLSFTIISKFLIFFFGFFLVMSGFMGWCYLCLIFDKKENTSGNSKLGKVSINDLNKSIQEYKQEIAHFSK